MKSHSLADNLNFGRKLLFASLGVAFVAGPIVFGLLNSTQVRAESQVHGDASLASFEVASIRPNHSGRGSVGIFGNINPPPVPVDRFVTTTTAWQLIKDAYDLQGSRLTGGPSWIKSERFDIEAKIPDSIVADAVARKLSRTQQLDKVRLMIQSLLADRFKLKLGRETRELAVYALTAVKGGLRIAPVTGVPPAPPTPPAGEEQIAVLGQVSAFVNVLSMLPEVNGRTVVDQTGLKGDYLWSLHWTPENPDPIFNGPPGTAVPRPDSPGPSIFTAIQEQLGLRLESTKGPVDTFVIEHVEEPSEN